MIKPPVKIILFVLWLSALFYGIYEGYGFLANDLGYKPRQPVEFSHKTHSGDFQIKCLYCHSSAEHEVYSQISTTNECLACHIALKAETDLMAPVNMSYDEDKPIFWKQVYRLPDYAHFKHKSHIRAMIDCSSCHGEVESMDITQRTTEITMKWCIDCHRNPIENIIPARDISGIFAWKYQDQKYHILEAKPSVVPFYGSYISMVYENSQGLIVPRFPTKGPEDCSACHY